MHAQHVHPPNASKRVFLPGGAEDENEDEKGEDEHDAEEDEDADEDVAVGAGAGLGLVGVVSFFNLGEARASTNLWVKESLSRQSSTGCPRATMAALMSFTFISASATGSSRAFSAARRALHSFLCPFQAAI